MILKIIHNKRSGKNLIVDEEWLDANDDWSVEHTIVDEINVGELTSLFRKYKKKYPKLHTAVISADIFGISLKLEPNG